MKIPFLSSIIIAFAASIFASEIPLAQCPTGVQNTITQNLKKGVLNEVEIKIFRGSKVYVAEVDLAGGRDLEIYVKPNGTLLRTKEEILFKELPPAVLQSIKSVQSNGRIDSIDRVTHKDKVTYTVEIDYENAPDVKLTLSPDGKILKKKLD